MGWTGTHKEAGETLEQFFDREMQDDNFKWVGKGCKKGDAYYRAMTDLRTGKVFCMVCLVRIDNKEYCNITYKDMTDSMGPCAYECPDRILDLLTETDSEWGKEWREKCRANNRKAKDANKMAVGTVIRFKNPISFSNDRMVTDFKIVLNPWAKRKTKALLALHEDGNFYARVTKWKEQEYEIV